MECAPKRAPACGRWVAAFIVLALPLEAVSLRSRPVKDVSAQPVLAPTPTVGVDSGVADFNRSALASVPGAAVQTRGAVTTMDLPVFVPGNASVANSTKGKVLTTKHFAHTFNPNELDALNYSQTHGWMAQTTPCSPANTIFDFGFYDGADGQAYLEGGFCVVGVEADPTLVQQAVSNFAVWMATNQLQVANVAISPTAEPGQWTTFYTNKCTKEWNSFYPTVGCRACAPPHKVDYSACDQVPIAAVPCEGVFQMFGKPLYLKLDIEGAEPGCFAALGTSWGQQFLPQFMSAEITQVDYVDTLYNLGYRAFKLVRQDRLHSGESSRSGPWGHNALDCRAGPGWRTYEEARAEMAAIITKGFTPDDPCPGGLCSIHGEGGCKGTTYIWYDIHVTTDAVTYR